MMLLARPALSIACVMPACSDLRFSLAMRPAGLSAPVLIFRPVLKRCNEVLRLWLFRPNTRCATSELTLVLILLMMSFLDDASFVQRFCGPLRDSFVRVTTFIPLIRVAAQGR